MAISYKRISNKTTAYIAGNNQLTEIETAHFEQAAVNAHKVIDQISTFEVDIFSILGMRNLSAFIGELYAASLIKVTGDEYRKNPHQDGYPDLILMDEPGKALYAKLERAGQLREKGPFSPFANGGIEVKATCGSVPTPDRCRRLGLEEKPDIGDQRIGCMIGYDWKAHHRETNNLIGIFWDFIDRLPRIVAVFFSSNLDQSHWGAIVQPREGGGRTTSVSIMSRGGVAKMYEKWIIVTDSDPRYRAFLNRHNRGNLL